MRQRRKTTGHNLASLSGQSHPCRRSAVSLAREMNRVVLHHRQLHLRAREPSLNDIFFSGLCDLCQPGMNQRLACSWSRYLNLLHDCYYRQKNQTHKSDMKTDNDNNNTTTTTLETSKTTISLYYKNKCTYSHPTLKVTSRP